jgi:hypothetical protein
MAAAADRCTHYAITGGGVGGVPTATPGQKPPDISQAADGQVQLPVGEVRSSVGDPRGDSEHTGFTGAVVASLLNKGQLKPG